MAFRPLSSRQTTTRYFVARWIPVIRLIAFNSSLFPCVMSSGWPEIPYSLSMNSTAVVAQSPIYVVECHYFF